MRKQWLLLLLIPTILMVFASCHTPDATEMAGYYRLSKENSRIPKGTILPGDSGFSLGKDHRFEMTDVPSFGDLGAQPNCYYDGTGKWGLRDDGEGVMLYLTIDELTPVPGHRPLCGRAGLFGVFEVLGHSRPFRIWYTIGDPDREQGLTYELQKPEAV
jgi:hypothetical protein